MRALGLPLDVDEYVARFPELAETLRRQMEVSDWLVDEGRGGEPLDQPASSATLTQLELRPKTESTNRVCG